MRFIFQSPLSAELSLSLKMFGEELKYNQAQKSLPYRYQFTFGWDQFQRCNFRSERFTDWLSKFKSFTLNITAVRWEINLGTRKLEMLHVSLPLIVKDKLTSAKSHPLAESPWQLVCYLIRADQSMLGMLMMMLMPLDQLY